MAEKIGIRAATIVIKEDKILLVNSKYDSGEFYLFPGGGIDYGETIEEGAIRETLEETGVKVKIKKLLHVNEFIYKDDWNKRSIAMFFLATPEGESDKSLTDDGGKIKQIKWIDLEKLRDLDIRPKLLADILMKAKGDYEKISMEYSVDFKE